MQSGYKTLTPIQLSNIFFCDEEGHFSRQEVQVYFGCCTLVAIREAAKRYKEGRGETPKQIARYRLLELSRLTEISESGVKRALRRLEQKGILTYTQEEIFITTESIGGLNPLMEDLSCHRSPKRPIPVPRSMLRFLAQNKKVSLSKTIVAYLARGLSLSRHGGIIINRGTVKISWISETMGLSERAARYARQELIRMGWIQHDENSHQLKLNRDGAYFAVNLDWAFVKREKESMENVSDFAPPLPEKCTVFAPPIENKKTSIEDKYQKPRVSKAAGIFLEVGKAPPTLRDIKTQDLWNFHRLEELFFQAVAAAWIPGCEASALNFLAAAVRAREVGEDPPRVFVTLVRKGLWNHINQAQEDRARAALVRFRMVNPNRFRILEARRVA
jgi:Mn-dependent DtxR family transcriptional regulator